MILGSTIRFSGMPDLSDVVRNYLERCIVGKIQDDSLWPRSNSKSILFLTQ